MKMAVVGFGDVRRLFVALKGGREELKHDSKMLTATPPPPYLLAIVPLGRAENFGDMAFMFHDFICFVLSKLMMVRVGYSYPGRHLYRRQVEGCVRALIFGSPMVSLMHLVRVGHGLEISWKSDFMKRALVVFAMASHCFFFFFSFFVLHFSQSFMKLA